MDVLYYKLFFNFIEVFAFILPALPSSIWIRLVILLIYLIAHFYKLQYKYAQFKRKYTTKREPEPELEENITVINPAQIDSSSHDVLLES